MTLWRRVARVAGTPGGVIAAIVGLLLAALTTANTLAIRTLDAELVRRLDTQLLDEARTTRRIIETVPEGTLDLLAQTPRAASSTALIVVGPDGTVIEAAPAGPAGSTRPLPKLPPPEQLTDQQRPFELAAAAGGLSYRAVAVPTIGGNTLVVAAPLDTINDIVAVLVRRLMLVSVAVLVILAILIWVVLRNANRQVDHLTRTAARIGAGDLTARVDLPAGASATRLSNALNDMTAQLESAFAAREASEERLRQFAADASHELRTPLTHIRGYAELLRTNVATSPQDRARAVERIEDAALRMSSLVEDLLLLARLDQERPLETTIVDASKLLKDCVADAQTADPERRYVIAHVEEAAHVAGDTRRLHQVVANLFANIRVHTPPATTATARVDVDGDCVVITVADDGPGMAREEAARAFDRFYRAEDARSRATGGSGLGLAIARAIVETHHGTVELRAKPGEGTEIRLTFPALTSRMDGR